MWIEFSATQLREIPKILDLIIILDPLTLTSTFSRLAIGAQGPSLALTMEVEPFQFVATLSGHEQDIRSVNSLDDGTIITGSRDSTVRLWKRVEDSPETPYACTSTLMGHTHYVGAVAPGPDGGVASGSNDKHVIEWDTAGSVPKRVLEGHTDTISCVATCASSGLLLSASWDKTTRVWKEVK